MKISRITFIICLAILIAFVGYTAFMNNSYAAAKSSVHQPNKPAAEKTIVGYVRDSSCLLTSGAKGESHRQCAIDCIKKGSAMLIEEEKTGKLYLVVSSKPMENPNTPLLKYCERKVKVTGKVFTQGGMQAIAISKVEAAK
ncbi:MAG: hypothetical protein M1536_06490 [Firmicutes bacterium]|nr:hypothetical protein [Bacillota bacterium]